MANEVELASAAGGGGDTNNKVPLPDIEQGSGDDPATLQERMRNRTLATRIVQGVAIAAFALNIVAMALEASAVVIVAGIIALVVAAVVFKFQFDLQDTDSLRQIQNRLRRKVNEFAKINTSLTNNVNRLETETSRLKEAESKLDAIATKQGKSVEKLKEIVKVNRDVIEEKKELIKADAMQAIMAVVIESDFDESGDFSEKEVNRLVLRMKNLPSIEVNEKLLRAKVTSGKSLHSVIDFLQDIESADADSDKIFRLDEEEYEPQ